MLAPVFGRSSKRDMAALARDVAAARRAASDAASAADRAEAAAVDAAQLVRDLADQKGPNRSSLRNPVALCVALLLGMAGCTWLAATALTDPVPTVTRPGSIAIAVATPPSGADPELSSAATWTVVRTSIDEASGSADYTVSIPAVLEGYVLKILLAGSAVLHDIAPVVREQFEVSERACTNPETIPNVFDDDLQCQVLTGVVGGPARYPLQACRDGHHARYDGDYFELRVWGVTEARDIVDWAHTTTSLPDASGESAAPGPIRSWNGFQFDTSFEVAGSSVCRTLVPDSAMVRQTSSSDPSLQPITRYTWGPDSGFEEIAVTSARRWSGVVGNLLLTFIGLLAAGLLSAGSACFRAFASLRRQGTQ